MNDWLNDELEQIEQAKRDKRSNESRLNLIQQQTSRVWEDLRDQIRNAVGQINASDKLREITGPLECQDGYTNQIIVNKSMIPAIYLTVKVAPTGFDIKRQIVTNGTGRHTVEQKEVLHVDLDNNGQPFLKTEEGKALTLEQAVHALFRLFLHPELVEGAKKVRVFNW